MISTGLEGRGSQPAHAHRCTTWQQAKCSVVPLSPRHIWLCMPLRREAELSIFVKRINKKDIEDR